MELINRQAAIDYFVLNVGFHDEDGYPIEDTDELRKIWTEYFDGIPPAQPEINCSEFPNNSDTISRQQAIDALNEYFARIGKLKRRGLTKGEKAISLDTVGAIKTLPSAQPERTCVNCGRTANNGGWYADGGTRCPIEEHYALPKDGFCHLWEKRNVTDDDYPERRTDG